MKIIIILITVGLIQLCAAFTGAIQGQIPVTGGLPEQQAEIIIEGNAGTPCARMWASLLYHPGSERVFMFGGGRLTDSWVLDAGKEAWFQMDRSNAPTLKRMGGVRAAYDTRARRMIIFFYTGAGLPGETWSFDPVTSSWTDLQPHNQPISRRFTDLVYDSTADRTMMFGGILSDDESAPTNELWAYDFEANAWEQLQPAASPPPVFFTQLAYATASQQLILWGGKGSSPEKTVWAYNMAQNVWTKTDYEDGPNPDYDGAMTYDTQTGLVFVYIADELWAYDPVKRMWQSRSTLHGPGMQYGASMVVDDAGQQVVLFGGTGNSRNTWLYDPSLDRWRSIGPDS